MNDPRPIALPEPRPFRLTLPETPRVAAALGVLERLHAAGHEAWMVGGAVRNALLGAPIEDIDLTTDARPEQVRPLFDGVREVGAAFGVMLVEQGDFQFELATFRAEADYRDHRHPSVVRYGTRGEDFERRDFTVNAMYYDPTRGRLYDPAGGRHDLAARLLRTVGEPGRRFGEDALRLLRAVRFAMRYDLAIEAATRRGIERHAATLGLIAPERVAEELGRILTGPRPGRAMTLMSELGLWRPILPEVEAMRGVEQPPNFHPEGDVFVHTALVLDTLAETAGHPVSVELALGALLHDVGKPPTQQVDTRIRFPEHQKVGARMAEQVGRRLRLSKASTAHVATLVSQHMRFGDVHHMKPSTLRRLLGMARIEDHLALHKADCLASHGKLDNWAICREKLDGAEATDRAAAMVPPPLLTGHDLIALGLEPGPQFTAILDAVQEQQLNGELADAEAARNWVREQAALGWPALSG